MTAAPTKKRRWLPRFSLRSLLLLVFLIANGVGLWWRWEPWVFVREINLGKGHPRWHGFSPIGYKIMSSIYYEESKRITLKVWDARTGRELRKIEQSLKGHSSIHGIGSFSPKGKWIMLHYYDPDSNHVFRIWDSQLGTGAPVPNGEEGSWFSPAFSPNDQYLLIFDYSPQKANVFEISSGKKIASFPGRSPSRGHWLPSGQAILLESGSAITVWQPFSNEVLHTFKNEGEYAPGVAWILDDRKIAITYDNLDRTFVEDRPVREFFRIYDLERLDRAPTEMKGAVEAVHVSPKGIRLLTISNSSHQVYEVANDTGRIHMLAKLETSREDFGHFGPNGDLVVFHEGIFDSQSGVALHHKKVFLGPKNRMVCFSKEPAKFSIADSKTSDVLWEHGMARNWEGATFSSDGNWLALYQTYDVGHVAIWRLRRPEYWYGIAWLWEFWACLAFTLALGASLWKDYQQLGKCEELEP